MKLGYALLTVFICLTVLFGWMYLQARNETKSVDDVLSIDERIVELRQSKFAKCGEITTIPLDKLDSIVKTCWSYLQLQ